MGRPQRKKRKRSPVRQLLSPKKILIPIGLGIGVASFMLIRNFDREAFTGIDWTWHSTFWIFMALLMMAIRDVAYMYRLRVLTNYEMSWRRSFDAIMLWEFASSITPSVVGGAPIAIFIVNKEGINLGRATTIVLITSLFDELFYITMVPILYFLFSDEQLFPAVAQFDFLNLAAGAKVIFLTSYALIVFYCCFISYGIFIHPKGFKTILMAVFRLPILRRLKEYARQTGDEIITASEEVKKFPFSYWVKAFFATYFSWTARYWVVNCLILAFIAVHEHWLIYARQLVMWVIMLISPTPGGSGIAEFAFSGYLQEFIPEGLTSTLAFLWRLISYYPYLFIGVIILPGWIRRVYLKRKLIKFKTPS